jgi:hypothetical protein
LRLCAGYWLIPWRLHPDDLMVKTQRTIQVGYAQLNPANSGLFWNATIAHISPV